MLSFTTEFPVQSKHGSAEFLNAIRDWRLGSPHTRFTADDLLLSGDQDEWFIEKGNERIDFLRIIGEDEDAASVRHVSNDGDLEWSTEIVFSKKLQDSWVGIRVSCESSHPARQVPNAKKPVIVRTLLDTLGGAADGELTVSRHPHKIGSNDIGLAARLISGDARCHLPVVYVSCRFNGGYAIDPLRLADKLAGMAHVVIEPNRPFSLRLKIEVSSENVYGGAIGIYWPDGGGRRALFMSHEYDSAEEMTAAIALEIRTALTNRRPLVRCTRPAIQESVSRKTFNALKSAGSNQVEKYIEEFDKEIKAKDEKLAYADREIDRLRAEIRKYETQRSLGSGLLLKTGSEQDLYTSEILDVVLISLKDAMSRAHNDSRKFHILNDLVSANTIRGEADSKRDIIKDLLREYRSMDSRIKKNLEDIGFDVQEDGKHCKLVFQGDGRYTFSLPKTGSDHRGGLNAASDISKKLFQ